MQQERLSGRHGARLGSAEPAELVRLRGENKRLLMQREISKKTAAFFEREEPRYRFIEEHRRMWPVRVQCRVLEVSRSGTTRGGIVRGASDRSVRTD